MPPVPVLNTYATRKKNNVRIPKFLYKDVEGGTVNDVFDALSIESIKEKKAKILRSNQNMKRDRKKQKENNCPKVQVVNVLDSTFDRLVREGPTSTYKTAEAFTSTSCTIAVDNLELPDTQPSVKQLWHSKAKARKRTKGEDTNNSVSSLLNVEESGLNLGINRISLRKRPKMRKKESVKSLHCNLAGSLFSLDVSKIKSTSTPLRDQSCLQNCKISPISSEAYSNASAVLDITVCEDQSNCRTHEFSARNDKSLILSPMNIVKKNAPLHSPDLYLNESMINEVLEDDAGSKGLVPIAFDKCGLSAACDFKDESSIFIDIENFSGSDCQNRLESLSQASHGLFTSNQQFRVSMENSTVEGESRKKLSADEDASNKSVRAVLIEFNEISQAVVDITDDETHTSQKSSKYAPEWGAASTRSIHRSTDDGSEVKGDSMHEGADKPVSSALCKYERKTSEALDISEITQKNIKDIKEYLLRKCDSHLPAGAESEAQDYPGAECSIDRLCEIFVQNVSCSSDFCIAQSEHLSNNKVITSSSENIHEDCIKIKELCKQEILEKSLSLHHKIIESNSNAEAEEFILKPGKQWRRSLSLLSKSRHSDNSSSISRSSIHCKGTSRHSMSTSWKRIQDMKVCEETICEDREANIFLKPKPPFNTECKGSLTAVEDEECPCNSSDQAAKIVLSQCDQTEPLLFSYVYPSSMKDNCKKIGEGVYGEVFLYNKEKSRDSTVIKIIPIEGKIDVNGEPQKTFDEIMSEICIAQQLSRLWNNTENSTDAFNRVQAVRCVKGSYPDWLTDLWIKYDSEKGSENDSPTLFGKDQLFIVLELSNGGKDVESFLFSSAEQGLAAFQQVAVALAVGERALCFEHRDLHWGNVLISSTNQKEITFVLDGQSVSTVTKGVKVSIIDFTLSRISDPVTNQPIFNDLAKDDALFMAQGDYQFEVYRLMKQYCGNKWANFTPKTNIAWLHYLLDKLCSMARYQNRRSKRHNNSLEMLLKLRDEILKFQDAYTFVKESSLMINLLKLA